MCRSRETYSQSPLTQKTLQDLRERKFWNRPAGAEAILQVRAALLSDGDPLARFIHARPGQLQYRRTPPTAPSRQRKKV